MNFLTELNSIHKQHTFYPHGHLERSLKKKKKSVYLNLQPTPDRRPKLLTVNISRKVVYRVKIIIPNRSLPVKSTVILIR